MTAGHFIHLHVLCFLAVLAVSVVFLMATRRINLRGLLQDGHGQFSVMRAQALMATGAASAILIGRCYQQGAFDYWMPLPQELAWALGGSHVAYLAGKAGQSFELFNRVRQLIR